MDERGLARFALLTGVVFFVLAVTSFALTSEPPDADESTAATVLYWVDNDSGEIASAIFATYAAFFFLWFAASLRGTIARVEQGTRRLVALTFGGAVVTATGLLVNNTLQFAAAETAGDVPPQVTQTLSVLYADFFFPMVVGIAVFLLDAGLATLRLGILPVWLGWAAIVLGIVCLTPVGFFGILAMLLWVLVASIVLFTRGADDADVPPAPAATAP